MDKKGMTTKSQDGLWKIYKPVVSAYTETYTLSNASPVANCCVLGAYLHDTPFLKVSLRNTTPYGPTTLDLNGSIYIPYRFLFALIQGYYAFDGCDDTLCPNCHPAGHTLLAVQAAAFPYNQISDGGQHLNDIKSLSVEKVVFFKKWLTSIVTGRIPVRLADGKPLWFLFDTQPPAKFQSTRLPNHIRELWNGLQEQAKASQSGGKPCRYVDFEYDIAIVSSTHTDILVESQDLIQAQELLGGIIEKLNTANKKKAQYKTKVYYVKDRDNFHNQVLQGEWIKRGLPNYNDGTLDDWLKATTRPSGRSGTTNAQLAAKASSDARLISRYAQQNVDQKTAIVAELSSSKLGPPPKWMGNILGTMAIPNRFVDQAAIMGISAPTWKGENNVEVDENGDVKVVGVNNVDKEVILKMGSGFYIAEWLHLVAHGFGGLYGHEPDGKTGQIAENLMIGTSETNSMMVRYEQAWQLILHLERAIQLAKNPNKAPKTIAPVTAKLSVYKNHDQQNNRLASYGIGNVHALEQNEINLSTKVPCIVFATEHVFKLDDPSAVLRGSPEQKIHFYPFSRMPFLKFENILDNILITELYINAAKRASDTVYKKLVQETGLGESFKKKIDTADFASSPDDEADEEG
ncbi:hypothetical protein EDC01DRAFT_760404 [Geopyxis carbonaria]|nr:hypothetical protein EDC01DRAFT_760404 [Geopyxis carbonaria]